MRRELTVAPKCGKDDLGFLNLIAVFIKRTRAFSSCNLSALKFPGCHSSFK